MFNLLIMLSFKFDPFIYENSKKTLYNYLRA